MPNFDIVRKSKVEQTFRVQKIAADFDLSLDCVEEHFKGEIQLPDDWHVGLIVGKSGTGKSTIAKEMFPDAFVISGDFDGYDSPSVVDDMPSDASVSDITKTFCSVGFSSVPDWLKPYSALSTGEKMRVDMARAILTNDLTVFDEFTSTVDREVAKTCCIAVSKSIRREGKKFVAVTCHKDVLDYLEPDWVFDTDDMQCFFPNARADSKSISSSGASVRSGESLGVITI